MQNTRNITDSIIYIGADDRRLELFENLFPIPNGVSYNSYLILDEKNVLLDTVDASVTWQFIENLKAGLNGKQLDYLVVNHMEPDHCFNIQQVLLLYPNVKLIGNKKTFDFMKGFFDIDLTDKCIEVKDKEKLNIGKHTLNFVFTPMLHWPEVMMTFEETEGILFSADAFGSFGTLNGALFTDEIDFNDEQIAEMRRYYTNIVGKYGMQVVNAVKKLADYKFNMICPLHGLVWRNNFELLLGKHTAWATYQNEDKEVAIFYGSMYGNTKNAANILATLLKEKGVNVKVYDASKTDVSYLIAETFRCSNIVIASPTYNNGIYPAIANLLHDMQALAVQNKTVSIIENGTWAPTAAKQITAELEKMKNINILPSVCTIKSALKEESLEQLKAICAEIVESLK